MVHSIEKPVASMYNGLGNDINIIVIICVWIITLWDFIVITGFMGFCELWHVTKNYIFSSE